LKATKKTITESYENEMNNKRKQEQSKSADVRQGQSRRIRSPDQAG